MYTPKTKILEGFCVDNVSSKLGKYRSILKAAIESGDSIFLNRLLITKFKSEDGQSKPWQAKYLALVMENIAKLRFDFIYIFNILLQLHTT